jgi:hypothetical protein
MRRISVIVGTVLTVFALFVTDGADAGTSSTSNWLQHGFDGRHQGFNPFETQITPANAGSLLLTKVFGFSYNPTPPLFFGNTVYAAR